MGVSYLRDSKLRPKHRTKTPSQNSRKKSKLQNHMEGEVEKGETPSEFQDSNPEGRVKVSNRASQSHPPTASTSLCTQSPSPPPGPPPRKLLNVSGETACWYPIGESGYSRWASSVWLCCHRIPCTGPLAWVPPGPGIALRPARSSCPAPGDRLCASILVRLSGRSRLCDGG